MIRIPTNLVRVIDVKRICLIATMIFLGTQICLDLIIRVASAFQTVSKLGSLAIMLEVEDWELQMRDLRSARLFLAKEATRKLSKIKIVEVLKQPALKALRSAEMLSPGLSEIWPSTSVCGHAPPPDAESIFQMRNIG